MIDVYLLIVLFHDAPNNVNRFLELRPISSRQKRFSIFHSSTSKPPTYTLPYVHCFLIWTHQILLDNVTSGKIIKPNVRKVWALEDWEPPTIQEGVQGFVGLTNYYKKYIKGFSLVVALVVDLLNNKNIAIFQDEWCNKVFNDHKKLLISLKVFKYSDISKPFEVHTDVNDFAIGSILMQNGRRIVFEIKKLIGAQLKWPTHYKDLFVVVLRI